MDDSLSVAMKQCTRCKEWKPLTPEFFYPRKDRPSGFVSTCKTCVLAHAPAIPKPVIDHTGEKQCRTCKEWKPATREHFYFFSRTVDGLGYTCIPCTLAKHPKAETKYCAKCDQYFPATTEFFYPRRTQINGAGLHSICKFCAAKKRENEREYMRLWRLANPDKLQRTVIRRRESGREKEDRKRYQERHRELLRERRREYTKKYPERIRETAKRYYETHQERIRAYRQSYDQRPERKEAVRQYQRAHPEIIRAINRNRIARKRAAQGNHTVKDIRRQYAAQKGKCYYCHDKLTKYHVDHIVPLIRGGSNSPDNLVVTCPTCNLRKHDKLPHEWPEGNRLL